MEKLGVGGEAFHRREGSVLRMNDMRVLGLANGCSKGHQPFMAFPVISKPTEK
jgi:hypothetical protein